MANSELERVQKVLARLGIASRRVCEEMIVDERVTVNGKVVVLGDKIGDDDQVCVDGVIYSHKPDLVTYLLNKPAKVITAVTDDRGRKTVIDFCPTDTRLFPVGRLDFETEGLLLLTNDGDLTHRLTHPSFGVEKEYLAELDGTPSRGNLKALREGIQLEDGLTAPAKATSPGPNMLRITIHEGRNRQVRRMCEAIGLSCLRLVRTKIGSLVDPKLAPGEIRLVSDSELLDLQRAITTKG